MNTTPDRARIMPSRPAPTAKLVCLMLLVALAASLLVRANLSFDPLAVHETSVLSANAFTWLREFSYITLAALSALFLVKTNRGAAFLFALTTYVALCITRMTIIDGDIQKAVYGVRVVVVALAFPALLYLAKKQLGQANKLVSIAIKVSLLALGAVAIYQAMTFPGHWGSTMIGARANGVYSNPITFSMVIASLACVIYMTGERRAKYWLLYCLALTLLTGGRAGILSTFVVCMAAFLPRRFSRKSIITAGAILLLPITFIIISDQRISGREGAQAGGLQDGRLNVWSGIMKSFDGLPDLLVGTGVGDGTNAARSYSGSDAATISDSTFIMLLRSFGAVGLSAYLAWILYLSRRVEFRGYVVLMAFVCCCAAQSMPEMHPAYLMFCYSLALSLARKSNQPGRNVT